MKPVKLELELDSKLYKYELKAYASEDGSGYGVHYTSKQFSEELTTKLVHGLNTWNANMCHSLVNTLYIHSGDLLLYND